MTALFDPAGVVFGPDGLVTAIVQDPTDGRVLMVGWMDREALDATVASGDVHFHSRSRRRLWRKGEASGNTLRLVGLELDCDGDAILVTADPGGPTCHSGARSCFDDPDQPTGPADQTPGFGWLDALWRTIDQRSRTRPLGSYTASLLAAGVDATSRKVSEEALEVVLAAKDDAFAESVAGERAETQASLAAELADLVYHTLVLAAERAVPPEAVLSVLRRRHRPDEGP
ncbi:MAG TPA: bifunctional phosphoribosyl-AMP cyclohydrolase/phosphoribosyl-ATP diphosphatase HisIE [Candidatus Limnocylindrales bacterium]|nr:bifunctional phosphoribosyl-AMP cyclohydrolase/phosphoribosyl-ATP diphosphatase HisIE [Candidatus Limnocylindrales bacterium]